MEIKTIKQLKDLIKNIDDDFELDISILERLSDNEILISKYPFPWRRKTAILEFHDVGYSDKQVCFGIKENIIGE